MIRRAFQFHRAGRNGPAVTPSERQGFAADARHFIARIERHPSTTETNLDPGTEE